MLVAFVSSKFVTHTHQKIKTALRTTHTIQRAFLMTVMYLFDIKLAMLIMM